MIERNWASLKLSFFELSFSECVITSVLFKPSVMASLALCTSALWFCGQKLWLCFMQSSSAHLCVKGYCCGVERRKVGCQNSCEYYAGELRPLEQMGRGKRNATKISSFHFKTKQPKASSCCPLGFYSCSKVSCE